MGGGGYAAGERSLRPPTMIERHMANTPASAGVPPPMPAFNYNQQYGYEGQGYGQGYGYDQGYNTGFQTGEVMPGGATAPPESYGYSGEPAFLNRQRSMSSSGHGHSGYTDLQRNPSMNAGYADLQRNPSVGGYGSGYPVGEAMNAPMPIMSPPPPAAHIGSSAIASDISTTQASALAAAAAAARFS
ncbi:hypothetical protein L218DRAFT_424305 [Marasmius fiardii PR-910]|nr:hypothetical protein L218DRAFT_424305 [Marasmius fiardii PR-910]